ncbi:MAG: hypothetical protein FJ104_01710 [Deltaproteobacteria bacterium]|nr:hypothetical protein [Deltaproteobacteria bacterium]
MSAQAPAADVAAKTVTSNGTTYDIQDLGDDRYVVLLAGVPVGRIVYTFGAANGVPEGGTVSEDELTAIGEAWFAALDA